MKRNFFSMVGGSLAVLWLLHPISTPPVPREDVLPKPVLVADYIPPIDLGGPPVTKGTGTRYKGATNG